jgi:biotin transport system substrate-specific component
MMRRTSLVPSSSLSLTSAALAGADSRGLAWGIRAALVLFMAVLTAAASQISVPLWFTPVPFTLQPMVVLLGAALLGPRLGAVSQLLYLGAGLAGLPVFAASPMLPQGPARILGPTGGYLMAYPAAAWVTGLLAEKGLDRRYLTAVASMLAGLLVIFTGGVLWLATFTPAAAEGRLLAALQIGFYPFILPDLVKVAFAATLLPAAWRLTGLGRRHV